MSRCISYKCLNKDTCCDNPYNQFGGNYCFKGIKPYCFNNLCNNCCRCCCPIAPSGMMPPLPPLPPPVPPPPPGRIVIGEGIFIGRLVGAPGGMLTVEFINGMIQGIGIAHNDGDTEIMLIPNTTYEYSYSIEIRQLLGAFDITTESFLTLNNVPIAGSLNSQTFMGVGPVTLMRAGSFTTDNNPNQILQLEVLNRQGILFNLSNAMLMIEALQ